MSKHLEIIVGLVKGQIFVNFSNGKIEIAHN